mmetsp:Transcript_12720/g.16149  ORF Transcript_12720/g.16149 Transcript_12720/m.16149 type:complete len:119 (+) Transcript_12720:151-507(+)
MHVPVITVMYFKLESNFSLPRAFVHMLMIYVLGTSIDLCMYVLVLVKCDSISPFSVIGSPTFPPITLSSMVRIQFMESSLKALLRYFHSSCDHRYFIDYSLLLPQKNLLFVVLSSLAY